MNEEKDKKRYWLRGGIIGLVLGFIAGVSTFGILPKIFGIVLSPLLFVSFALRLWMPIASICKLISIDSFVCSILSVSISSSIISFILFAVLGWLYGKYKNRGKNAK